MRAMITGASSGIGRDIAINLAKLDYDLILVGREREALENVKNIIGDKVKIKIVVVDLSNLQKVKELYVLTRNDDIDLLVNNAGFAKFCSYGDLSVEESLNMMHVNMDAVVAMGLVCIPYMKKGSHMINIASQASFQPLPYQNIYSSTKSFVRNYSRALNVELKEKGICVTAVCPGWIKTDLYKRAEIGARKATTKYVGMVTPDKVAKKALKDAKKCKDISIYSLFTKISHIAAKLLPQRMMMKIWLKQQHLDDE